MWVKNQNGTALVNLSLCHVTVEFSEYSSRYDIIARDGYGENGFSAWLFTTKSKEECEKELAHLWKAIQQGESWHYMGTGTQIGDEE